MIRAWVRARRQVICASLPCSFRESLRFLVCARRHAHVRKNGRLDSRLARRPPGWGRFAAWYGGASGGAAVDRQQWASGIAQLQGTFPRCLAGWHEDALQCPCQAAVEVPSRRTEARTVCPSFGSLSPAKKKDLHETGGSSVIYVEDGPQSGQGEDRHSIGASMLTGADLAAVYENCRNHLLAVARRGVPCDADAEDVLHEAFARFFQRAPRALHPDEAGRYLTRCVVNAVSEWWRAANRQERSWQRVMDCPSESPAESPHAQAAEQEELESLRCSVARLPDRQRQAVMLRYFADLPVEEVAGLMECKPGTVRSLIRHGINRLKEILEQKSHLAQEGGD